MLVSLVKKYKLLSVVSYNFCRWALKTNGVIVIKENITSSENLEIDTKDSSVTRPLSEFYCIFQESNLICIKEEQQHKFPRGLYPVYMFALKPNNKL